MKTGPGWYTHVTTADAAALTPAIYVGDRLVFRNKEYHRLFEEANRSPDEAP